MDACVTLILLVWAYATFSEELAAEPEPEPRPAESKGGETSLTVKCIAGPHKVRDSEAIRSSRSGYSEGHRVGSIFTNCCVASGITSGVSSHDSACQAVSRKCSDDAKTIQTGSNGHGRKGDSRSWKLVSGQCRVVECQGEYLDLACRWASAAGDGTPVATSRMNDSGGSTGEARHSTDGPTQEAVPCRADFGQSNPEERDVTLRVLPVLRWPEDLLGNRSNSSDQASGEKGGEEETPPKRFKITGFIIGMMPPLCISFYIILKLGYRSRYAEERAEETGMVEEPFFISN
ncbi:uncharacterized protein LOC135385862 [Ornithodoros turicata]|uniref:uncharacterized protein LOC135385862 n=1 Tax=Ornithodoros turicata TaxID=34597 RepID=UPI00313A1EFB